ncbi:MAG: hypothetical protein KBD73_01060 [Candidatus Magasanikbacteria bacterium]|nr:hypothetical protein [Candidatus Magasanikbacteria bacterium]
MLISVSKLIDESYKFYSEHREIFFEYVKYLFIAMIGYTIIVNGGTTALAPLIKNNSWAGTVVIILILLFTIALAIGTTWISLAIMRSAAQIYERTETKPVKEELKNAVKYIWPSIVISLLVALAQLGGLILLVVPAIIFGTWFAFANYTLVLDDKRGTAALSASKALVKGRWWEIFWKLLLLGLFFGIILSIIPGIISLPFDLISAATKSSPIVPIVITIIGEILSTIVRVFLVPFPIVANTILYLELKKTPVQNEPNLPVANISA